MMDNEEAIRRIREHMEVHKMGLHDALTDEALTLAIGALIKQTPRGIVERTLCDKTIFGYCPNCGSTVMIRATWLKKVKGSCCDWCGQRLDLEKEAQE